MCEIIKFKANYFIVILLLFVCTIVGFLIAGNDKITISDVKDVSFNNGGKKGDPVLCAISETNKMYISRYEEKLIGDPESNILNWRDVVIGYDMKGLPFVQLKLEKKSLHAMYATDTDIYGILDREPSDTDRSKWKLIKISLSGIVLWEKEIKLATDNDRYKASINVETGTSSELRIVKGQGKDELLIVWHGSSDNAKYHGDMGSVSVSMVDGKAGKAVDGVINADGKKYRVFGHGLVWDVGEKTSPDIKTDVVTDKDGKWIVDFYKGRLIVQVSKDGKTGPIYFVEGTKLKPLTDKALPFGVRNNGDYFYIADEDKRVVHLYAIKDNSVPSTQPATKPAASERVPATLPAAAM